MKQSNAVFLATRSLWWTKGRAVTITLCLTLTICLPITARLLLGQFRSDIEARSARTPLVIGARGSRIDLAVNALYFDTAAPQPTTMAESDYIAASEFAVPIPIHIRFRTQSLDGVKGVPIVGTSVEYFEFRNLALDAGSGIAMLGDCVLGYRVAAKMGLKPGDRILSAPRNAFNLAGDYPLKMNIVGVLKPSHSPDDNVVFVDLRTAWVIEGIGHGHQGLNHEGVDNDLLLKSDDRSVTASAAVLPYTEITADNLSSFHFHGDESTFPITAVIAAPHDRKSRTLLLGRYATERKEIAQCVAPENVVDELMSIVFRVEKLIWVGSLLAGLVTVLLIGLIILLTARLRETEMNTMFKLGCSQSTVAQVVGTEISFMLITAIALAIIGAFTMRSLLGDWLHTMIF